MRKAASEARRLQGTGTGPADRGGTVARPALVVDERALRRLALDLFGRPATEAERQRWLGRGRHEILGAWLGTPAAWANWLEVELYYFLLIDNFRLPPERVEELTALLAGGRLDARQAVHRIVLSASFDRRNPGADTFVTVVLEQLAGLNVQKHPRALAIGKQLYDGVEGVLLERRGRSQADVIDIVIHSKEFARAFLARQHARYLRSDPLAAQMGTWVESFHRDPSRFPEILRSWLLSPGYDRRLSIDESLPNRLFVRSLFVDLTDRLPEGSEAEALREALDGLADSRPLRTVVARMLIGSARAPLPPKESIADPTAWIRDLFGRFLAREPEEAELRALVHAFHERECTPELVVEALVSDLEYHVW